MHFVFSRVAILISSHTFPFRLDPSGSQFDLYDRVAKTFHVTTESASTGLENVNILRIDDAKSQCLRNVFGWVRFGLAPSIVTGRQPKISDTFDPGTFRTDVSNSNKPGDIPANSGGVRPSSAGRFPPTRPGLKRRPRRRRRRRRRVLDRLLLSSGIILRSITLCKYYYYDFVECVQEVRVRVLYGRP